MTERDTTAKEFAINLLRLCTPLHRHRLIDGSCLHVWRTPHVRPCVEFFRSVYCTQTTLGRLGIFVPRVVEEPLYVEGFFNDFANEFDKAPKHIEIKAATVDEAFETISNCLAPLLDFNIMTGGGK